MTTQPLFTVVIPTIGRPTLARTLESIAPRGAEVIVVADSHQMDAQTLGAIRDVALEYGASFRHLDAGQHDTGSPQLALGYREASGQWILNLGDDDVFEPFAFRALDRAIRNDVTTRPLMFRTVLHPAPHRGNALPIVLWHLPEFARGMVTGQSFVCPNVPERLGRWTDDFTFMTETVEAWGSVGWQTEVISQCY